VDEGFEVDGKPDLRAMVECHDREVDRSRHSIYAKYIL
jgi:hypothetical protein